MSTSCDSEEVATKLDAVRALLAREITGRGDVCLTCSFQAEDVLLTKLALELDAKIPILFLDTGYHFPRPMSIAIASRRVAIEPDQPAAGKNRARAGAEHGLLYQSAPDQCCKLRKVEPLFKAVAGYRVWLTGLRREQARAARRWKSRRSSRCPAASRC
jgi:phosphoadenosine phosphosulfate reductase